MQQKEGRIVTPLFIIQADSDTRLKHLLQALLQFLFGRVTLIFCGYAPVPADDEHERLVPVILQLRELPSVYDGSKPRT